MLSFGYTMRFRLMVTGLTLVSVFLQFGQIQSAPSTVDTSLERVLLKNGDRISGFVLEETERRVLLESPYGLFEVDRALVMRIVYDEKRQRRLRLPAQPFRTVTISVSDARGPHFATKSTIPAGVRYSLRSPPIEGVPPFVAVTGSEPDNVGYALHGQMLLFRNGDRLSGQMLRFSGGTILFETLCGPYTIPRSYVRRILISNGLPVALSFKGHILHGMVESWDDYGVTFREEGSTAENSPVIPWADVDEVFFSDGFKTIAPARSSSQR